jgi:hypothetical protein
VCRSAAEGGRRCPADSHRTREYERERKRVYRARRAWLHAIDRGDSIASAAAHAKLLRAEQKSTTSGWQPIVDQIRGRDTGYYIPDLTPSPDLGPPPGTNAEIDEHVVAAVRSLETRPDDLVSLANVRAIVHPQLSRAVLDEALRRINLLRGVTFAPEEDQAGLVPAEREAALRLGTQDMHLIAIE